VQQVVSGDRTEMVARQLDAINKGAATLGVKIVDIRIKRIDLPTGGEVIEQVYRRMRAQRQQVAAQLRAEGEEQSQKIRSEADRQQQVILAEAERDAQKLRGEGDAEASRIYAQAYQRDPAFYAFHRSLEAYRRSFANGNAAIVLDRDDPFLQYLRNDR
jgi:membrane protease subunit HflC